MARTREPCWTSRGPGGLFVPERFLDHFTPHIPLLFSPLVLPCSCSSLLAGPTACTKTAMHLFIPHRISFIYRLLSALRPLDLLV